MESGRVDVDELAAALTPQVAREVLDCQGQVDVVFLRPSNHTWRVDCERGVFFVKAHSKDWYRVSVSAAGGAVAHEAGAHRMLKAKGLETPTVVAAERSAENPLGWPYLLTERLTGTSLVDAVDPDDQASSDHMMEAVGAHLARIHAITFEHPGYVGDGPPRRPEGDAWQHPIWTFERFALQSMRTWSTDAQTVPPTVMDAVMRLFAEQLPAVRSSFSPPRFTHGDCHANQFFLLPAAEGWAVSGVLDLEVASSGCVLFDFVKFFIEMRGIFAGSGYSWWRPLFTGYGGEPEFDVMRVLLAAASSINYTCGDWNGWPSARSDVLRLLTTATDWSELLAGDSEPAFKANGDPRIDAKPC
jgi:Ser/Thr protein kinase RdoA (MazF antagonist)